MFIISGDGVLVGVVMGTYFASALRIVLGVNSGSGGGTMVGLAGREKYVASLGQVDLMRGGKEPVEF